MPSPGRLTFTIKGLASSADQQQPLPLPLPPLPPPQQKSYHQFVPTYAKEFYDSYRDMRSPGYVRSRSPPRRRSPPRGPRATDRTFTSDLVHPREARRDSRDRDRDRDWDRGRERDREQDRDRRRERSRSPPEYTPSRPSYREEDRQSSYGRFAQLPPKPQHLSTNGSSAASSPRPLSDRAQPPRVNSPAQSVPTAPAKTSMPPPVTTMAQATAPLVSPASPAPSTVSSTDSVSHPLSAAPTSTSATQSQTQAQTQTQTQTRDVPIGTHPAVTTVVAPDETHMAIVATFGEIFKQFGEESIDVALFKQKKIAAEKEKEKCLSDYMKSKENHAKFPSLEESQRRAREHAEKQLKLFNDQIKTKNDTLASVAMSAASKIPAILAQASGVKYDDSKLRNCCDDLQKRCDDLDKQLQTQKKLFEEEKKSRELLEKKVSDLESISTTTKQTLAEMHIRQPKFESDIRSEIAKTATVLDKAIQENKRDFTAQLSRESVDLEKKLQEELSRPLEGLKSIKGELDKVRKESSESLAALTNEIKPLADGIQKVDAVDNKVDQVRNSLAEWTVSTNGYRAQLKSWKIDMESDVANTRELTRSVNDTLKQELAAVKQDVTRVAPKPTTPSADISTTPLQSIQVIKSDITNLQDQIKNLDFTSLTKRISASEQHAKTFIKHSTYNEALNELVKVHESLASYKKDVEGLSNKISLQQMKAGNNSTASTASLKRLEQRLSKLETQLASGTQASSSKDPLPLPSNTVDTSNKEQYRILEEQLALLPSKDWVRKEVEAEVNTQQDAAAEIFVTRLAKVELQVNENERKVGGIGANVAHMTELHKALTPLPSQVANLKRQTSGASSSAELGALVRTAVQEATIAIDKKHTDAVTAVQLGFQTELWKQNGVYGQIEAIGVACSNLDQRYNNILTSELHKAIVDQIAQDHIPAIQRIPPLENLLRATTSQVAELEKAVKNTESQLIAISKDTESQLIAISKDTKSQLIAISKDTESPSAVKSENRLREVENAQTVLEDTIRAIKDEVKIIETKPRGNQMEVIDNDITTLNKKQAKLKTDLNDKISELSKRVEKTEHDIKDLSADHLQKQIDIAGKFADYELQFNMPRETTNALSKAPLSHNNSTIRDKDRKSSVPTPNGHAHKKRKLGDNGHSSHSPAPSSFSKSNGNTLTSPVSKKRPSRRPHQHWTSKDEEAYRNDDDEVIQPTLIDDASDGDD